MLWIVSIFWRKKIIQIPLQTSGPNAITRLTGIFAYQKTPFGLLMNRNPYS